MDDSWVARNNRMREINRAANVWARQVASAWQASQHASRDKLASFCV
jgi:hypothetical protein